MAHHSIIPDSGAAASDPGFRNEKLRFMPPWAPAFAGAHKSAKHD